MRTELGPFVAARRRLGRAVLALGVALLAASCEHSEARDPTGGETHFLSSCDPNSDSCGGQLVCLCGVCTQPCRDGSGCTGLGQAECAPAQSTASCADFRAQGHCDVECRGDADCAPLSSSRHCENGACRAGTCVLGKASTGDDVLFIGDSFFALTHEVSAQLSALAENAGALPRGSAYRDVSNTTDNTLAFGDTGIANQFASAQATAKAKVVVMNGGGADIILGACATPDALCPLLVDAANAAQDLLAKLANDGVQHVVYAFYPNPIPSAAQAKMDALRPLIQAVCETSPVPCHWLDLRTTFAAHYAEYISGDGLNPTAAGSQATAAAIWATMQQSCSAQ